MYEGLSSNSPIPSSNESTDTTSIDADQFKLYLDLLYKDVDPDKEPNQYIHLAYVTSPQKTPLVFNSSQSCLDFVIQNHADPNDLYVAVNVTDGINKQRTAKNITGITSLYLDVDGEAFTSKEKALLFCKSNLIPSFIVDSGNGYHSYFCLETIFDIETDADRDHFHELGRRLQATFEDGYEFDGAKSKLDQVADISRVLRPAGTYNLKDPLNPKPVKVISSPEFYETRYSLDDFDRLLIKTEKIKVITEENINTIKNLTSDGWTQTDQTNCERLCAYNNGKNIRLKAYFEGKFKQDRSANELDLCANVYWSSRKFLKLTHEQALSKIDAMMRLPDLYRAKWDEIHKKNPDLTYGQMTLAKVTGERKDSCDKEATAVSLPPGPPPNLSIIQDCLNPLQNERGDAVMWHTMQNNEYLYDTSTADAKNRWYGWTGTHWTNQDPTPQKPLDDVVDAYKHYSQTLYHNLENPKHENEKIKAELKQIRSRIQDLNGIRRRNRVLEMVIVINKDIKVSADTWNKDTYCIPFKNGIVDLKTGETTPHDKNNKIMNTFVLPFDYDEQAPSPMFAKVIRDQFEQEPKMIRFIEDLIAYCYSGVGNKQNIFPVFFGAGGEGKTILLDALMNATRPYAKPMRKQAIMHRTIAPSENEHTSHLESFRGIRFAPMLEIGIKDQIDIARLNYLTGGDDLPVRKCNGSVEETIQNQFTILATTNRLDAFQVFADQKSSMARIKIIKFPRSFRGTPEEDSSIKGKLRLEAQGIASRIVQWSVRLWKENNGRLCIPESVERTTKMLLNPENNFEDFIQHCVIFDSKAIIESKNVYTAYLEFMTENQLGRPEGKINFLSLFRAHMENYKIELKNDDFSTLQDGKRHRVYRGFSIDGYEITEK